MMGISVSDGDCGFAKARSGDFSRSRLTLPTSEERVERKDMATIGSTPVAAVFSETAHVSPTPDGMFSTSPNRQGYEPSTAAVPQAARAHEHRTDSCATSILASSGYDPAGRPKASRQPCAERMHIVVTGHVDHGKSTVIGRLLADTGSLPEGKLATVVDYCERNGQAFEYAFLLDALRDERAQGITIDAARVFFKTARREYVILDAPGHVEFVKNMISGASHAEAALLVIDAREGIQENSRRHGFLLSMLGIRQIAVLINKMDLVGDSKEVYQSIMSEYGDFLARIGVTPACFVPVTALHGGNIARRLSELYWYDGPTVLEALDRFEAGSPLVAAPFRMPVQGVYKFGGGGNNPRIVAGTVCSGRIRIGDEIVFYPSGKRSRLKSIEGFNRQAQGEAVAEEATGFTLEEQIYVQRGEVATLAGQARPRVARRIRVSLFWLGRQPLGFHKDYILKIGTARTKMRVEQVHRVMDAAELVACHGSEQVERHKVAECTLSFPRPIVFDLATDCAPTGRFVIIDDYEICGGGIVREALDDSCCTSRPAQSQAIKPAPAVIWFTGLSGAGKSTIAEAVADRLHASGAKVEYLDGDAIRNCFPETGFTRAERDQHVQRVGFLASRLQHHGVFALCALISPYAASRRRVRAMCERFVEIHVATPLDECERRDVKGLYGRARRGEIEHFTGVDDPYEPPSAPELRIDTTELSIESSVEQVMAVLPAQSDAAEKDE